MLLGWTAGFALGGVVIGGVANSTSDMAAQSAQLQTIIERLGGGARIADAYLAAVMGLLGVAAAGYATQATLRLRAEEEALRADQVLATPAGRLSWAASHLVFGVTGPAAALVGFGLTAGLVHGLLEGDVSGQLPRVLAGALVQLLAVWVLCGIATAVFGLLPRLVPVAWGALAVFGFLALLGPLLRLDQVVMDVSPFSHVPKLPGGQVSLAPLLWLLGLAVVLGAAGLRGFRRRDVGVA
jgi:ABC-2 type transport system permease protein